MEDEKGEYFGSPLEVLRAHGIKSYIPIVKAERLTIEWSRQYVRKVKAAEFSRFVGHSKNHTMLLPLEPIFNAQLSKQILDVWVCSNYNPSNPVPVRYTFEFRSEPHMCSAHQLID